MAKAKIGLIGLVGAEAKEDFWETTRRVAETGVEWIVVEQDQLFESSPGSHIHRSRV